MKKYVIFLICLIMSFMTFGQDEIKDVMIDVEEVEVSPPEFTGIQNATTILNSDNSELIKNYLMKYINCPVTAECGIEGTEIVQFTVTASGDVSDFKIINSVCREIDDEVIRVLKTTKGMWMPGLNNGETTAMEKEITAAFANCKDNQIINHFTKEATTSFTKANLYLVEKQKPKKALRFYNHGVRYLPNDNAMLMMRGLCFYALGDKESAERDWSRIADLGGFVLDGMNTMIAGMEGYSKMKEILARNK